MLYATSANGRQYDPIHWSALNRPGVNRVTLFTTPGLVVVGVGWAWAVALKLVRYEKADPYDIAHILRLGEAQRNVVWTRSLLEEWLNNECRAMGYARYSPKQKERMRQRIDHALALSRSFGPR